ncbi:bacteriohemerythrin [Sapientia aquatica]|uniref:Hemerythrin-like domain-containing protein n=1 Tax=Sapientia aquatica TaxID=1549640 RepID=A0A4R5W6V6_9BURK|nr:hemerythrin domain-containing protein [Sapientia aquatica]TDK68583.1 hypothetical protein E2I14_03315 [Sapientia aquatica]
MERIEWTPDLSLGLPDVDAAHKLFLDQLVSLADAPDSELVNLLPPLIAGMESDFYQEEALMEKVNYPEIKVHREQHARVLSALHNAMPDVLRNDFALARKALELLPQWSVMHIITVDKALALYLKEIKALTNEKS